MFRAASRSGNHSLQSHPSTRIDIRRFPVQSILREIQTNGPALPGLPPPETPPRGRASPARELPESGPQPHPSGPKGPFRARRASCLRRSRENDSVQPWCTTKNMCCVASRWGPTYVGTLRVSHVPTFQHEQRGTITICRAVRRRAAPASPHLLGDIPAVYVNLNTHRFKGLTPPVVNKKTLE